MQFNYLRGWLQVNVGLGKPTVTILSKRDYNNTVAILSECDYNNTCLLGATQEKFRR
jgi:hypothetical protein